MTARVLRPVLTISAVAAILIAALAVYAFLTAGSTHADSTFGPQTVVKFCNDLPAAFGPDPSFNGGAGSCVEGAGLATGAHPDNTTQITIPKGDLNFSNVVTLAPNSETIAAGNTMPAGEKMGAVHSDTTLGTFNNACNLTIGVDFLLWNVKLPDASNETTPGDPRTSTIISYPQPQGTVDRFGRWGAPGAGPIAAGGGDPVTAGTAGPPDQTLQSMGTTNSVQGYPSFLLDAFDPDFNALTGAPGPLKPIVPLAVYGGLSNVVGSWIPLYFVQFSSGQLTALTNSPLAKLNANMGQPSVAVLNDPTEAPSPSSISDFCSLLRTTTDLLGTSSPSGDIRVTNPAAATTQQFFLQYVASQRDTDQDSYENQFDACPLNPNQGAGRVANGPGNGDADSDGIDNSCDTTSNPGVSDQDGDGYQNRQDNCPQVANGAIPDFQKESELDPAHLPAADNGPGADGMGDPCDTGTISVNQNNQNNAGSAPSPAPAISITMSPTVANGRYMTSTNLVAKCIGGPDLDGDGYCGGTADAFDAVAPHNAARHTGWSGAAHPALQMDSDGTKGSDAGDTWLSQCDSSGLVGGTKPCGVLPPGATPNALAYVAPPGPGATPGYTLGVDPAHSCAQTTTAKDEGPWDNWSFDFNDDGLVNGSDFLVFSAPYGKTVDMGLVNEVGFKMGWVAIYRFDLNHDGYVNGNDFLTFAPVYGKTCAQAGLAPFSQQ